MSPVLIATFAGLATAFCWGTADWLSARGAKQLSPIAVNLGVQISSFVMALAILAISRPSIPAGTQLIRIVAGTTLVSCGFLLLVKALSSGVVGIIVPIGNSYPLVTIFLSVVLLGVTINATQYAAFASILLGAAILAYEKNVNKVPLRELHKESVIALMAALVFGIAFFVLDPVVSQLRWQSLIVTSEAVSTTVAILIFVSVYRRRSSALIKKTITNKAALLTGLLGTSGLIGIYIGANASGNIIIPAVLSSVSPLVSSFWGAIADHEKIGVIKRAGAIILIGGVVLLNLA